MKFISDEDFVELGVGMPHEKFEGLMADFMKRCVEETLKTLPSAISHLVKSAATMQSLAAEFYSKNPNLVDHKDAVAKMMEKLESEHPEMNYKQLMEETGQKLKGNLDKMENFNMDLGKRPKVTDLDNNFGDI